MKYSFEGILRVDYTAKQAFLNFCIFLVLVIFYSFLMISFINEYISSEDGTALLERTAGFIFLYIALILICLTALIVLLKRLYDIKHFQGNCSEIDAEIVSYKPLKDRVFRVRAYEIIFSYNYKNKKYTHGYSIGENARYLYDYSKPGGTVSILVRNDNPNKIMMKELFYSSSKEIAEDEETTRRYIFYAEEINKNNDKAIDVNIKSENNQKDNITNDKKNEEIERLEKMFDLSTDENEKGIIAKKLYGLGKIYYWRFIPRDIR